MIISIDNLKRGLEWRAQNWPDDADVRNYQYKHIYEARSKGINEEWWDVTVKRLSEWRAIRPRPKNLIQRNGINQLGKIKKEFKKLNAIGEPCITNLQWANIEELFNIASTIKPSRTPVFASKMCHFLFPKLFIVIDNEATGVGYYELYWRGLKDAWNTFEEKEQARKILYKAIQKELHHNYPEETTIMEICTIGYKHSKD